MCKITVLTIVFWGRANQVSRSDNCLLWQFCVQLCCSLCIELQSISITKKRSVELFEISLHVRPNKRPKCLLNV